MSAAAPHHVLRRALIGGYRVADVEVALAELRLAAARLETELQSAARAREASEVAADDLRRELGNAQRIVGEAQSEALALRRTVDEIADSARRSVAAAQEETQALRELPDVTDVYLRQFEDRRVRVEVSVRKPVRLVEDIVARLPFSIDVTPDDAGRAVLTLDPAVGE